ncbi:erg10, acetyl-CoA C-acetyltransferase [Rhizophlyctis rosea]|uniref:acetyl-CoA C-acetyltransferase n=1 Tax=Rhizophlyctis rosea TaxID=64517 RepID=A0AAD5X2Q3_9FUNG|nr:erg10, acetyl-CoA C-acetyltransferase [Rhizophlyctis rosea]
MITKRLFTATAAAARKRNYSTSKLGFNDIVIVSAARTPVGSFMKSLAKVPAVELGALAIKATLDRANLDPQKVEEVFMGNVISAGIGQAPARQAAIKAGLPYSTEATTVNKVCASGMKAIIFGAQTLQLGDRNVVVAGGMEKFGNQTASDGILKDGLWDVYNNMHMGTCADLTAAEYAITREDQDLHAIESYRRAKAAWDSGLFKSEIVPVTVKDRKGDKVIDMDDEYRNIQHRDGRKLLNPQRRSLRSSPHNLRTRPFLIPDPIAKILSFGEAATEPKKFTIAPSLAIPIALERAGVRKEEVELWEVNEAFSVVVRVNEKILGLDPEKVNTLGGAVALGHPIGSSAARIVVSLTHALKSGQIGVAAVCNGGGAASAMVIQRL